MDPGKSTPGGKESLLDSTSQAAAAAPPVNGHHGNGAGSHQNGLQGYKFNPGMPECQLIENAPARPDTLPSRSGAVCEFFAIKKQRRGNLLAAARHNRRALQAELGANERIDARQSWRNIQLRGADTPEGVVSEGNAHLAKAGRLRKDAVAWVEFLFSLRGDSHIDPVAYFTACTDWCERHFGCPIISSDIHFDEAHPHCHVMLVPLVEGNRMNGAKVIGHGHVFEGHRKNFFAEVGRPFGLAPGRPSLKGGVKTRAAQAVVTRLKVDLDPGTTSPHWPRYEDAIRGNPAPWLDALGIVLPTARPARQRSFTAIMISRGKGRNWEPDEETYRLQDDADDDGREAYPV